MTNFNKLPEQCFGVLKSTGETILIKRGESGYYPQDSLKHRDADELNEIYGVTKAQRKAMEMGSMVGWNAPASDPDRYDEEGNWIR